MAEQPRSGGNGNVVEWRLNHLESEVTNLWDKKASHSDFEHQEAAIKDLRDEVASLRRTIVGACVAAVTSSALFLLAVLEFANR